MYKLFATLIGIQFLVIVLHDFIDIPGLVHGSQVRRALGKWRVLAASLANAVFPGVAFWLALSSVHPPRSRTSWIYEAVYCSVALGAAFFMWYVPYFQGKVDSSADQLHRGTWHLLPPRGNNAGPDFFHMGMHLLFLTNFVLMCLLSTRWGVA